MRDELFMRIQQWTVFHPNRPPVPHSQYGGTPRICEHIYEHSSTTVLDVLQPAIQHGGDGTRYTTCNALRRCTECATAFEIGDMRLDDGNQAVVITKWVNFGGGRHVSDPKWQRHLGLAFQEERYAARCPDERGLNRSFEWQPGRTHAEVA